MTVGRAETPRNLPRPSEKASGSSHLTSEMKVGTRASSSSALTPRKVMLGSAACCLAISPRRGSSSRQGAHQVAQKLRTTRLAFERGERQRGAVEMAEGELIDVFCVAIAIGGGGIGGRSGSGAIVGGEDGFAEALRGVVDLLPDISELGADLAAVGFFHADVGDDEGLEILVDGGGKIVAHLEDIAETFGGGGIGAGGEARLVIFGGFVVVMEGFLNVAADEIEGEKELRVAVLPFGEGEALGALEGEGIERVINDASDVGVGEGEAGVVAFFLEGFYGEHGDLGVVGLQGDEFGGEIEDAGVIVGFFAGGDEGAIDIYFLRRVGEAAQVVLEVADEGGAIVAGGGDGGLEGVGGVGGGRLGLEGEEEERDGEEVHGLILDERERGERIGDRSSGIGEMGEGNLKFRIWDFRFREERVLAGAERAQRMQILGRAAIDGALGCN